MSTEELPFTDPYTVVQVTRVFPYNYGGAPLSFYGTGPTLEQAERNLELELEKVRAALEEPSA